MRILKKNLPQGHGKLLRRFQAGFLSKSLLKFLRQGIIEAFPVHLCRLLLVFPDFFILLGKVGLLGRLADLGKKVFRNDDINGKDAIGKA